MILDVACGSRMFWFDKDNADVIFGDKRIEEMTLVDGRKLIVSPDVVFDFTALPFSAEVFSMVVFDPPHLKSAGQKGWQAQKYGVLESGWPAVIEQGFSECFRVLSDGGFLIFKWNEMQIKVSEILPLAKQTPLFGHKRVKSDTHWICFGKKKELA